MIDERRPITRASAVTTRSTCRRLAPSVRSIANSRKPLRDRDRERVEDDERADEHRDHAERQERRREEASDRVVDVSCLVRRVLDTRLHLDPRGADGRTHAGRDLLLRDPRIRGDTDLAELALLAEPVLDGRQGRTQDARAASRRGELDDPRDTGRVQPRGRRDLYQLADLQVLPAGDALVDREIGLRAAARREAPLDELADSEVGGLGREDRRSPTRRLHELAVDDEVAPTR